MATSLTKDKIKDEVFLESVKKRHFRSRDGQLSSKQEELLQRLWDNAENIATKAMEIVNPR